MSPHDSVVSNLAAGTTKLVPEFKGYVVSRCGNVFSCLFHPLRNRHSLWIQLKPGIDHRGRRYVGFRLGKKTITRRVHRLVALAFIGPEPAGMECCHNDGNPANNHVDNLRWDTHASNCGDMLKHGTRNFGDRNGSRTCKAAIKRGSEHWNSRLTEAAIAQIHRLRAEGLLQRLIAERFGITQGQVSQILARKLWAHV